MTQGPVLISGGGLGLESQRTELPSLAGRLVGLVVPTLFVHSAGSRPAAAVQVFEGVGHFAFLERSGAVRADLDIA